MWLNFRPTFANCGLDWPTFGPKLIKFGPMSTRFGPSSTKLRQDIDQTSADFDQIWADLDRLDRFRSKLDGHWPNLGNSGQIWGRLRGDRNQHLKTLRPNSADVDRGVGSLSAKHGRNSAHFEPIAANCEPTFRPKSDRCLAPGAEGLWGPEG